MITSEDKQHAAKQSSKAAEIVIYDIRYCSVCGTTNSFKHPSQESAFLRDTHFLRACRNCKIVLPPNTTIEIDLNDNSRFKPGLIYE